MLRAYKRVLDLLELLTRLSVSVSVCLSIYHSLSLSLFLRS